MTKEKLKEYIVTELAGNFVAGRRSPGKDKTIELTLAQAETPLRNGEIKGLRAKKVSKNADDNVAEIHAKEK